MRKVIFTSLVALSMLAACSEEADQKETNAAQAEERADENRKVETAEVAEFPKTIELNGQQITIATKPERILPLSLDVAEIALELVEPSRIVAASKSIDDPYLSAQVEKAKDISERVASAVNIDPEQVLSYNTDLLLLTKMHGQEADADKILSQAGIPILSFDSIPSVEGYFENVKLIGQAIGEEEKANALVSKLESEIKRIQSTIPTQETKPTVLVLSEVGPGTGPYMISKGNISYDIIQLAGAEPAVDKVGLDRTTQASIEQVIKMDPDYIFLLDWQGEGEAAYNALMQAPGWSTLRAVAENKIKLLETKYLLNPNAQFVEGLEAMANFIYNKE